jgi:hypothetical protein
MDIHVSCLLSAVSLGRANHLFRCVLQDFPT